MNMFDKTCTIYPFVTEIVDEQERQKYSATPSYTGGCDYRTKSTTFADGVVVQQDIRSKEICLPGIVSISVLSKVVLDNGQTYKVTNVESFYSQTGISDNTLLSCIHTDG